MRGRGGLAVLVGLGLGLAIVAGAPQDAMPPSPVIRDLMDSGRQQGDMCGVTAIVNEDGRMELFALGYDGGIHHRWQFFDKKWSNWVALPLGTGVGFVSGAHPIRSPDGRLQLFAVGSDGALYHNYQSGPGGPFMKLWTPIGGPFRNDITALLNAEGLLTVFAQSNTSRSLMYNTQRQNATSVYWAGWLNLGGALTASPSGLMDAEGLMHVFVRGVDNALYFKRQSVSDGVVKWGPYDGLGGLLMGTPAIPANLNPVNLIEVFTRQADGAIWYTKQKEFTRNHTVAWSEWQSLGGRMSAGPQVVTNNNGLLEIFARGEDMNMYVKEQLDHDSVEFHMWSSLGGNFSSTAPTVLMHPDGSIHVFFRGADQSIYQRSKVAVPNSDDDGDFTWQKGWTKMGNDNGLDSFFRPFMC